MYNLRSALIVGALDVLDARHLLRARHSDKLGIESVLCCAVGFNGRLTGNIKSLEILINQLVSRTTDKNKECYDV